MLSGKIQVYFRYHFGSKLAYFFGSALLIGSLLLDIEIQHRNLKDMERKTKEARLPGIHNLQEYDCSLVEGMPASRLEQLKELTWLDQKINLIVLGPNGIGKSFLLAGLCHHALKMVIRPI